MKTKLALLTMFLLGVSLGVIIYPRFINISDQSSTNQSYEKRATKYKFISPLLECDIFSPAGTKELVPLKRKLEYIINTKINERYIDLAAIYFRDLNNGPWFGINENQDFAPGSLLKLPIMISLFKIAETDRDFLNQKLIFNKNLNYLIQDFMPPSVILEKDKEYTIDDLITRMIDYSDNESMFLLLSKTGEELTNDLYRELELKEDFDLEGDRPISVKAYSSLFRVLFNTSYLDRLLSEKALDLLSRVEYKNGLVAGVPSDITVAHKFGERNLIDGTKQLHDCGIVYYPNHPYLLCIMTRGTNFEKLELTIRSISRQVYQKIDEDYREKPK